MESRNYSNLGLGPSVKMVPQAMVSDFAHDETDLSTIIHDCSKNGWESLTEAKLLSSLSYELKNILEIEDLRELVQDFIQIDHQLHIVLDNANFKGDRVGLEGFYKNLSILLMRMALEEEVDADSMKRSIEIALEEEIYSWQEHLS